MEWMKIVGCIWVILIVLCAWDFFTAPIMPADYNEDGINPDHEKIEDER
tara:strand:- start:1789 stop:1935 length:147 start_codon:yes stop_codon:yes gene_type:complete